MANHCKEVICARCGAEWCLRGCNHHLQPDPERVLPLEHPVVYTSSQDPCPHCGGTAKYSASDHRLTPYYRERIIEVAPTGKEKEVYTWWRIWIRKVQMVEVKCIYESFDDDGTRYTEYVKRWRRDTDPPIIKETKL